MKVAVIGGGSSYTPELVEGLLAAAASLSLSSLILMDTDPRRLSVCADFARRMAARQDSPFEIRHTTDLAEAVSDAKYVITQIRVGKMDARIRDEKLGIRHGLVGQETTGVGGFACALRTIPAVLDVAHAMEERSPEATLINFTNPSGIVTEALLKHSTIRVVGLCNIPIGIQHEVARLLGCAESSVELDYVGLNHLAWVRKIVAGGTDKTKAVLDAFIETADNEFPEGPICEAMRTAMRRLGMVCNPYLQYFYATSDCIELQGGQARTRGEEVAEIEQGLFERYTDPEQSVKPAELGQRGGAHYSTAAIRVLTAIDRDAGSRQIVCCRNSGAIPTLDDDAAVEVPAIIDAKGAASLPQSEPEPSIVGLLQTVKAYESLTVRAAVEGDRDAAVQAMQVHPLMPEETQDCRGLVSELLEINREHLSETFFRTTAGVAHGR